MKLLPASAMHSHDTRTWTWPLETDFPNRLADPTVAAARRPLAARPGLWLLLLLLCFASRALMAVKIETICPDAALYIHLAEAIEQRDWKTAFNPEHLSTLPPILWGLHQFGLPWELAGCWWSVTIATLAVLPLFGWMRRQFDDRIATLGAVLYAVHPNLIERSPEILRDPTFWFLVAAFLYVSWRAVTEVRLAWFLLAGVLYVLAVMTRFEGLFLIAAPVLWSAFRYRALHEHRGRLVWGVCGALPAFAVVVALVALVALRDHQLVRTDPLLRVRYWAESWLAPTPPPLVTDDATIERMSPGQLAWQFAFKLVKGIDPIFGLFLLCGQYGWRRVYFRRDHQVLLLVALCILGSVYVHLWYAQIASRRYMLSIVLMATPFAALGIVSMAGWANRGWNYLQGGNRQRTALVWLLLALVMANGWVDALTSKVSRRLPSASLGAWIDHEFGDEVEIAGSDDLIVLMQCSSGRHCQRLDKSQGGQRLVEQIQAESPDIVLLSTKLMSADECKAVVESQSRLGLRQIDPAHLPPDCENVILLARDPAHRDLWVGHRDERSKRK